MKTKPQLPSARFEPTQIEVGTGGPGYRWAPTVFIITPDNRKLYPPMQRAEAKRFCENLGWTVAEH